MIIDELITDRTQDDVDEVYSLKRKFKTVDDSTGYILVEHLTNKDLVFDGTQAEYDKYMAGLKGALNYGDLNRIGNAIRYIKMLANALNLSPNIVGKNDWQSGQYVQASDAGQVITDLNIIKTLVSATTSIPSSFNSLTYVGLNNMEKLLKEAYEILSTRLTQYQIGGAVISGVNDWLTETGGNE